MSACIEVYPHLKNAFRSQHANENIDDVLKRVDEEMNLLKTLKLIAPMIYEDVTFAVFHATEDPSDAGIHYSHAKLVSQFFERVEKTMPERRVKRKTIPSSKAAAVNEVLVRAKEKTPTMTATERRSVRVKMSEISKTRFRIAKLHENINAFGAIRAKKGCPQPECRRCKLGAERAGFEELLNIEWILLEQQRRQLDALLSGCKIPTIKVELAAGGESDKYIQSSHAVSISKWHELKGYYTWGEYILREAMTANQKRRANKHAAMYWNTGELPTESVVTTATNRFSVLGEEEVVFTPPIEDDSITVHNRTYIPRRHRKTEVEFDKALEEALNFYALGRRQRETTISALSAETKSKLSRAKTMKKAIEDRRDKLLADKLMSEYRKKDEIRAVKIPDTPKLNSETRKMIEDQKTEMVAKLPAQLKFQNWLGIQKSIEAKPIKHQHKKIKHLQTIISKNDQLKVTERKNGTKKWREITRDGKVVITTKHCHTAGTLTENCIDIITNIPLGPITESVMVEGAIYLANRKVLMKKMSGETADFKVVKAFDAGRSFISGTPIYNSEGQICSVITQSCEGRWAIEQQEGTRIEGLWRKSVNAQYERCMRSLENSFIRDTELLSIHDRLLPICNQEHKTDTLPTIVTIMLALSGAFAARLGMMERITTQPATSTQTTTTQPITSTQTTAAPNTDPPFQIQKIEVHVYSTRTGRLLLPVLNPIMLTELREETHYDWIHDQVVSYIDGEHPDIEVNVQMVIQYLNHITYDKKQYTHIEMEEESLHSIKAYMTVLEQNVVVMKEHKEFYQQIKDVREGYYKILDHALAEELYGIVNTLMEDIVEVINITEFTRTSIVRALTYAEKATDSVLTAEKNLEHALRTFSEALKKYEHTVEKVEAARRIPGQIRRKRSVMDTRPIKEISRNVKLLDAATVALSKATEVINEQLANLNEESTDQVNKAIIKLEPEPPKIIQCKKHYSLNDSCYCSDIWKICYQVGTNDIHGMEIEELDCVISRTSAFFAGHLHLRNESCGKTVTLYDRVTVHHNQCDQEFSSGIIDIKELKKPGHFTMPSRTTMFFMIVEILFVIFVADRLGIWAALVLIALILVTPTFADCDIDGRVYEATEATNNKTHRVYRITGTFYEGSCVHFGNSTINIERVYRKETYRRSLILMSSVMYESKQKYGCPGGEGYEVCESKLKCDKPHSTVDIHCTNSHNSAWSDTNCAFGGNLYINTYICTNYTMDTDLFEQVNNLNTEEFSYSLYDKHGRHSGVIFSSSCDTNICVGPLTFPRVEVFSKLIQYRSRILAPIDSHIFSDSCSNSDPKVKIPLEDHCRKFTVTQKGTKIKIQYSYPKWVLAVTTDQFKDATGMFDQQKLTMIMPLRSFRGYIEVAEEVHSHSYSMCKKVILKNFIASQGKSENYEFALIKVSMENIDCIAELSCTNCDIVDERRVRINATGEFDFRLICGVYTTSNCTISGTENSQSILLSELTTNPNWHVDKLYHMAELVVDGVTEKFTFFQPIRKFFSSAWDATANIFGGVITKVLTAIGVIFALQAIVTGNYILGACILVVSMMPHVIAFPCVRWDCDEDGMQYSKLACETEDKFLIHGIWNLPPRTPKSCDRVTAGTVFELINTLNWTSEHNAVEEYCKHGAHYGYEPEEYFTLANELCIKNFQYIHQCRYVKARHCNMVEQSSTEQINKIGCSGNVTCNSGDARKQTTIVLAICITIVCLLGESGICSLIVVYNIDHILYLLGNCTRELSDTFKFWTDRVRTTKAKILDIAAPLEPIVIMALTYVSIKMGFFAIAIIYYRKIKALVSYTIFKIRPTEEQTFTPVSTTIANLWPKPRPEQVKDEIEFHNGGKVVSLRALYEEFSQLEGDHVNIPVYDPQESKRLFYGHWFTNTVVVPKHCVAIDVPGAQTYEDVVAYSSSQIAMDEYMMIIAEKQCVNYKQVPDLKKGDSGLIIYGDNSFYMHSGVLRNGSPVCCSCFLKHGEHTGRATVTQHKVLDISTVTKDISNLVVTEPKMKPQVIRVSQMPNFKVKRVTTKWKTAGGEEKDAQGYINRGRFTSKFTDVEIVDDEKEVTEYKRKVTALASSRYKAEVRKYFCPEFNVIFKKNEYTPKITAGLPEKEVYFKLRTEKKEIYDQIVQVYCDRSNENASAFRTTSTSEQCRCLAAYNSSNVSARIEDARRNLDLILTSKPSKSVKKYSTLTIPQTDKKIVLKPGAIMDLMRRSDIEHHMADFLNSGEEFEAEKMEVGVLEVMATLNSQMDRKQQTEFPGAFILACYRELFFENEEVGDAYLKSVRAKNQAIDYIIKEEACTEILQHLFRTKTNKDFVPGMIQYPISSNFKKALEATKDIVAAFEANRKETIDAEYVMINFKAIIKEKDEDVIENLEVYYNSEGLPYICGKMISENREPADNTGMEIMSIAAGATAKVAPKSVPVEILTQQDTLDFLKMVKDKIDDATALNEYKPIKTPSKGVPILNETAVDHWLCDTTRTHIMTIEGSNRGMAFAYQGTVYTCNHVTNSGPLRIPYYSTGNGMTLKRESTRENAFEVLLNVSDKKRIDKGDYNIYDFAPTRSTLGKPVEGDYYVAADTRRMMYSILQCRGTKKITSDGPLYYTFVHIDVTKEEGDRIIPYQTKLQGMSGTPILSICGRPVGIWGTSMVREEDGKEIEVTLASSQVTRRAGTERLKIDTAKLYTNWESAKKAGKILRIQAPTGAGKSTKMVISFMCYLAEKLKRPVKAEILIPKIKSVNSLFEYMQQHVLTEKDYSNRVEIKAKHGDIDQELSSWNTSGQPQVTLTYRTYGSAAANHSDVFRSDNIFMDEIHTRNDSTVQAFVSLLKINRATNAMAMTATPFTGEDIYIDITIPGEIPYEITDYDLKKVPKEFKDDDYYTFIGNSGSIVAILKSEIKEDSKVLLFCPTINHARKNVSHAKRQGLNSVALTSKDINPNLDQTRLVICATDIVESSETIPGVDVVIDLQTCNRPETNITFGENKRIDITETVSIKVIDKCQKTQRRGRTGRTNPGKYYSIPGEKVGELQAYPTTAVIEAGILLNSVFDEKKIENAYTADHFKDLNPPIYWMMQLSPEQLARRDVKSIYSKESLINMYSSKIPILRNYNNLPSASFYITPIMPEFYAEIDKFYKKTQSATSILDCFRTDDVKPNKDFMDILEKEHNLTMTNDIFDLLRNADIDTILAEPDGLNQLLELLKVSEENEEKIKLKKNSWYEIPTGIIIGSVAIAGFAAKHIHAIEYGEKVVDTILPIPNTSKFDKNIWKVLDQYEYRTREYHKENSEKVSGLAITIYNKVKKYLRATLVQLARQSGDEKVISFIERNFMYSENSDLNYTILIEEWLRQGWVKVKEFNIGDWEDTLLLSAVPALGSVFNTLCSQFGESLTSIVTAFLSVYTYQLIGPTNYFISAGVGCLLTGIKNSLFLSDYETNYAPNFALATLITPFTYHVVKSALTPSNITNINEFLHNTVSNPVIKKEDLIREIKHYGQSTMIDSLLAGSGGADSGFALAMGIISFLEGDTHRTKTELFNAVSSVIIRAYNIKNMSMEGVVTLVVTVSVDIVLRQFIKHYEDTPDHSVDHIRSNDHLANISRRNEQIVRDRTSLIRKIYKTAQILVGAMLNPINIPFIILDVATYYIRALQDEHTLSTDDLIDRARRTILCCPLITGMTTLVAVYNIASDGLNFLEGMRNPFGSASALASTFIANSEGPFTTYKNKLVLYAQNSIETVRTIAHTVKPSMVIKALAMLLRPVFFIWKQMKRLSRGAKDTLDEAFEILRQKMALLILPDRIVKMFLSKAPVTTSSVEIEDLDDYEMVRRVVVAFGLQPYFAKLEEKLGQDIYFNFYKKNWFSELALSDWKTTKTLAKLELHRNPTALSSYLGRLVITTETEFRGIKAEDATSVFLTLAQLYTIPLSQVDSNMINKSTFNGGEVPGTFINQTVAKSDYILALNHDASKTFAMLIQPQFHAEGTSDSLIVSNNPQILQLGNPIEQHDARLQDIHQLRYEVMSRRSTMHRRRPQELKIDNYIKHDNQIMKLLAHTLTSEKLQAKFGLVLEICLGSSLYDYYLHDKNMSVERKLGLLLAGFGENANRFTEYLQFCYVDEKQIRPLVSIITISSVSIEGCVQVRDLHSLTRCKPDTGFEAVMLRILRQFESSEVLATVVNMITGKTTYVQNDTGKYTMSLNYSCCRKCRIVIMGENIFEYVNACRSYPLPKVTDELSTRVTEWKEQGLEKVLNRQTIWFLDFETDGFDVTKYRYRKREFATQVQKRIDWQEYIMSRSQNIHRFNNTPDEYVFSDQSGVHYFIEAADLMYVFDNTPDFEMCRGPREALAIGEKTIINMAEAGVSTTETKHIFVDMMKHEYFYIENMQALAISEVFPERYGKKIVHLKNGNVKRILYKLGKNEFIAPEALYFSSLINEFEIIHDKVYTAATEKVLSPPTIEIRNTGATDIEKQIRKAAMTVCVRLPDMDEEICAFKMKVVETHPKYNVHCILNNELRRIVIKKLGGYKLSKNEERLYKQGKNTGIEKIKTFAMKMTSQALINRPAIDMRPAVTVTEKGRSLLKMITNPWNKILKDKTEFIVSGDYDNAEGQGSSSEPTEAEIEIAQGKVEEPAPKLIANAQKSILTKAIEKVLCGTSLVSKNQTRNIPLQAVQDVHMEITRPVADAITLLVPGKTSSVELASIVHFGEPTHRILKNHYTEELWHNSWTKNTYAELPQGRAIWPLTESDQVQEVLETESSQAQKIVSGLRGLLQGKIFDAAKRWNRVYLPTTSEMSAVTRGVAKAQLIDRETGIFSNNLKVLDLSSGGGGFAQYYASLPTGHHRVYVMNTLSRPGHSDANMEAIYGALINAGNVKNTVIKKIVTNTNGDFRFKEIYDIALAQEKQYSLIICDCGEANDNLQLESKWLWKEHMLHEYKKHDVLSNKPIYAIEQHLKLLQKGGTLLLRINGFTDTTLKTLQLISKHFTKFVAYKCPTTSYISREWYLIAMAKRETQTPWPNLKRWLGHLHTEYVTNLLRFNTWARDNIRHMTQDLKKWGPIGFGYGLDTHPVKTTLADEEHPNAHVHMCRQCSKTYIHYHTHTSEHPDRPYECPNKDCLWYWKKHYTSNQYKAKALDTSLKTSKIKQRFYVPVKTITWLTMGGKWEILGPKEYCERMEKQSIIKTPIVAISGFPEKVELCGEVFYPQMDARFAKLKTIIKDAGYHIKPPSGMFEKIYEVGRVSFKEKYGKEKHTCNKLMGDMAFNVFGLNPANSVIGHTQCTEEFLSSAWKKRLDLRPEEPNAADTALLAAASKANETPEYRAIANGPDEGKFKPWTIEETIAKINNQGAGGHFDRYSKFKDAVSDPAFIKKCEEHWNMMKDGICPPTYQTCRDKRETKAKKNIDSDGNLILPKHLMEDDITRKLNHADKQKRREARKEYMQNTANIAPRNIRYAEFVQRFNDLRLLGPYQDYHNNTAKLYMGSTTGTPLWKLGDLMRGVYEQYCTWDQQEYTIGDKIIEANRNRFSKDFLTFFDKRNIKVEINSEVHNANLKRRYEKAIKCAIASGDFSGWDGTVTNTDHALEFKHTADVYQKKYRTLLKTRFTLYMFSLTITDHGHILAGWAQRGSGDQQTSSGNTKLNDNLHVGALAASTGKTCEEICKIIGVIHYRNSFGNDVKWKKYYIREMSNIADGDDNVHFAEEKLINLINTQGIQFLKRCGKSIRCGTSEGYSIGKTFSDIQFCSHKFRRTRIARTKSASQNINSTIESGNKPHKFGDIPNYSDKLITEARNMVANWVDNQKQFPVPFLNTTWTLVHQRIYDALQDLEITYLPVRPMPEILGKLVYTIKNEVTTMEFNRDNYGDTPKEEKFAVKNERAFEITRGKLLSYLLNYIHIESVRSIVFSCMSIIGDGTCDLVQLSKRFNVPSVTASLMSATKSVFEINDIREIETISREFDRRGLKVIRHNTKLANDSLRVGLDQHKVAPMDPVDLKEKLQVWARDFAKKHQIKIDETWLLRMENTNTITQTPVRKHSMLQNYLSMLTLATILPGSAEAIIIGLTTNLKQANNVGNKIGIANFQEKLVKKLKFKPEDGTTTNIDIENRKISICFCDELSGPALNRQLRNIGSATNILIAGQFKNASKLLKIMSQENRRTFKLVLLADQKTVPR